MLEGNDDLRIFVIHKITRARWTPEQIAGYLKYRQTDLPTVSHETIYKWIYSLNQLANKYWKFLPRYKRKRGLNRITYTARKDSSNRLSIHQRPAEISSKQEFGHWEGDLMSFIHNSQHALVLNERKTRYIQSVVLDNKQASTTSVALINLMAPLPVSSRKTLTLDNVREFAGH